MEIKAGQWVRIKNKIIQANEEIPDIENKSICYEYSRVKGVEVKIADTPQELVKVGDLIETRWQGYKVILEVEHITIERQTIYYEIIEDCSREAEDITKIWTPNSKGGYDLQWEA